MEEKHLGMKTPVILSYKTLKKSGELNTAYLNAIEGVGGELKMLESIEEIDSMIDQADGILLPGGNDVNPMLYGEERKADTHPPHNERDRFEMYLLEKALERKLPVLGICRGFQVINVKLGGTLYQDVEKEMSGSIRHDWHDDNSQPLPRSLLSHQVSVDQNSKLHGLLAQDNIEVNSLHHQGIKALGNGLIATAHSSDGLVEAVEMPGYPYLMGLQWHPEELQGDAAWKGVLKDFVENCSKGTN
jgi:putative glutamine amidotransferase